MVSGDSFKTMTCKICHSSSVVESPELNDAVSQFENKNYGKALELALPLAEKGEARAQCLVGGLYQTGLGGAMNISAAIGWLQKAGEQGCGLAWHNLSTIYLTGGEGLNPNKEEALRCRKRAIENGFDFSVEFPASFTGCYEDLIK